MQMHDIIRLFIVFIAISLMSCDGDNPVSEPLTFDEAEYLVFGHFYGECLGEQCVELFKIDLQEEKNLYEDRSDIYPGLAQFQGDFELIDNSKYDMIKALIDQLPEDLTEVPNQAFGCPDCADQGGIYIAVSKLVNGSSYWILDQDKAAVPVQYRGAIDIVNEAVALIND